MTDQELAQIVRTAVLDILKSGKAAAAPSDHASDAGLPRIRVLDDRNPEAEAKVAVKLRNRYPGGFRLCFNGECLAGEAPELIIVPSICCASMAKLATGAPSGRLIEIMKLLLEGNDVWVIDYCYDDYAFTAPAALYEMYAGYEKKLASFGLRRLPDVKPAAIRSQEKLITAKAVEDAVASGVRRLTVSASAIVTALAADAAARTGLEIVRDSGRPA
ncbi:MAG: hypothetical protein MJ061_04275 [Mailhella sp.]|nr:hypothetical protein [Mailhella sp.]